MKITITEQIKDVKMVYEFIGSKKDVVSAAFDLGFKDRWEDGDYGKVEEFTTRAPDEIRDVINNATNVSNLPEYLQGIDLSVIPDDWEEVWITQDSNGDIAAYNSQPTRSVHRPWWNLPSNNEWFYIDRSGNRFDDFTHPNWQQSTYRLR